MAVTADDVVDVVVVPPVVMTVTPGGLVAETVMLATAVVA